MPDQVDEAVRVHRAALLMEQQMTVSAALNQARIGTETEAVIEGFDPENAAWIARTPAEAPDVDGRLYLPGTPEDGFQAGQYVTVRITDAADYDLIGEVTAG